MDIEEEFKELAFNVIEIEKQSEAYYTYYEEAIKLINSIKSKFNSQRAQTHKNFQYVDQKNHEINKLCHENEKLKSDLIEMSEALVLQAGQQDSCPECGEWADFNLPIIHRDCTVLKAKRIIKEESQSNKGIPLGNMTTLKGDTGVFPSRLVDSLFVTERYTK